MEETITITQAEYKSLIKAQTNLEIILNSAFENSTLNYDGTELYDTKIDNSILKTIDFIRYEEKLKELKGKGKNNE